MRTIHKRTEIALLLLAAGIGELERALDRFLRGTVQFALGEKIARARASVLGAVDRFGTTFNSGHVFLLMLDYICGETGTCGGSVRSLIS